MTTEHTAQTRRLTISVVIPALNEAAGIAATLEAVRRHCEPREILVVDGGSDDETASIAAPHARVIVSDRGRGRQMNAGARQANGDVLLFLHADSLPEIGTCAEICRALANERTEAGIFRHRFDRPTPLLRFYSFCTRFPLPLIGFGDRGIFVRRNVFEEIGGFAEQPLFEDLDLVRRLHRRGGFVFLKQHVTTSARRFERYGALRQQLLNAYLWAHFVAGADPERIAHLYRYDGPAGRQAELPQEEVQVDL